MKRGFTLVELLVVIAIVGLLMAILLPSLSRAREQAKITAVNGELRQIGLALGLYFEDHEKYPPTQADCASGQLTAHLYQLPRVLSAGGYLPSKPDTEAMSTIMEDRFNRGRTYKYRSVGEVIKDRNIIDKWTQAKLWIPQGFPSCSSLESGKGAWYPNDTSQRVSDSPVAWVVFSIGPRFSDEWLQEKSGIDSRYPVPRELWYSRKEHRGFVVRMQLKNGTQIGSFE
jgi:prepilin-type N-terminal cleavage/methylation domain-containing protein